ncbi:hypothetical protein UY3_14748 [Chelonia mydas]|uniref:Uncharacterized protein n=1 Tax=Chelonia mydas TaxID=8469 RepID=M7B7D7_CHEMY|nr:hypothetical protein UY3_14748 [Chelonia mydas]
MHDVLSCHPDDQQCKTTYITVCHNKEKKNHEMFPQTMNVTKKWTTQELPIVIDSFQTQILGPPISTSSSRKELRKEGYDNYRGSSGSDRRNKMKMTGCGSCGMYIILKWECVHPVYTKWRILPSSPLKGAALMPHGCSASPDHMNERKSSIQQLSKKFSSTAESSVPGWSVWQSESIFWVVISLWSPTNTGFYPGHFGVPAATSIIGASSYLVESTFGSNIGISSP